jgi:hypothetical protein
MEVIWKATEENQGQESFQQTNFANFLDNLLSADSHLVYDQGRPPFPDSIRTLLSVLLEVTAFLDDIPAIINAVSLLSKYSQANPARSCGV